jgi:MFS family permease
VKDHPDPQGAEPPIHLDRDFRRLWVAGLLGSLVRWLEVLVFGVFTYQQTGSAMWVTSMTLLRMLPMALFGVAMGALASRVPRRTGLVVSYVVMFAMALVLLGVSVSGALNVWHLALASFVGGVVWAADNPMRRGFMGDIAGAQRMGRAMAMDTVATNGCRLAGPGLGGLLLAGAGMPAVFLFSAVMYLPVLAAVLGLRARPSHPTGPAARGVWAMLSTGLRTARDSAPLRAALWVTVVFNLFGWPALSLVPVIAQDQLGLGVQGTGALASMDGVGSLIGALVLTSQARRAHYGRFYVGGVTLFFCMLPLFAWAGHPMAAGTALLVAGVGQASFAVMQTTLVYVAAPPQRRAEAMGLLTMCIGMAPIGFLMVGALADRLGSPTATAVSAACGLATLALTWPVWRPCLRPPTEP